MKTKKLQGDEIVHFHGKAKLVSDVLSDEYDDWFVLFTDGTWTRSQADDEWTVVSL
jgi:hypothetical protein